MGEEKVKAPIICEGCGKPVLNPRTKKTTTHTSRIKGIQSECQRLRDNKKRKEFYKKHGHNKKKPLNRSTKKSVMRTCLGPYCQGKKKFPSISPHHRQCNNCINYGFYKAAVKIGH
jgi:hypothetical protein